MKDYSNVVLAIIDDSGKQYEVLADEVDVKHISAYIRMIKEFGYDKFSVADYIDASSNVGSITGFEIAKFVTSLGNVVFFHTDVHNAFLGKREASVMIPECPSNIQKQRVELLLHNLKDFTVYAGRVYTSKRKICYERIPYKMFLTKLNKNAEEMKLNERKK